MKTYLKNWVRTKTPRKIALILSLYYLFFSLVFIVLGDFILLVLPGSISNEHLTYLQSLKAVVYLLLTGTVFYLLTYTFFKWLEEIKKRSEKEQKTKDELLKLAFAGTMDGIWVWDIGKNISFDERWDHLLGYEPGEINYTPEWFLSRVHPDDLELLENAIDNYLTGKNKFYEVEYRIRTKSGDWRWIWGSGKASKWDENGIPIQISGTHRDITEKKKAEDKQRKSERIFRALFDNSIDGIVYSTLDNKYMYANKAFLKLIGFSHEEMLNKLWKDITPEKWHSVQDKIYKNTLFKTGQSGIFEKEYIQKSGNILPIQITSSLDYNNDNNPVGIWSIIRDISHIKKTTDALKQSEARFRTIVNSAPIGIALLDMEGKVTYVNKALTDLAGLPENTLDNKIWNKAIYPKDRMRLLKEFRYRIKNKASFVDSGRFVHPDGKIIWWQAITSPIYVDDKYVGQIGMVHDSSSQIRREEELKEHKKELEENILDRNAELERKTKSLVESQKALTYLLEDVEEARKELEDSNRLLEAANAELEAFSYSVSHDLRAPLRSIDGFSNALLEDYGEQLDEMGKDFLNRIHKASVGMGQLIEDLLQLSRISRMEINIEKVNVTKLAKDIARHLREQNRERKVNMSIEQNIYINTDRRLLNIMLENLIGNAWKFTRNKKDARIEIGLKKHPEEGRTILVIRDNGSGFDMKYEAEMYNPFKRLHQDKEFEGTGIGLATVKRIINRLGGHIRAESKINKGSAFFLEFKNEQYVK